MSDALPSSAAVSARMSRQGSRDTTPELAVRKLLHAAGLRYRVNVPVPGMPRRTIDIVFGRAKIAVFMDGCFWHGCPQHATRPKANAEWWRSKLEKNMARDRETTEHLRAAGWTVLRFWEHESPEFVACVVAEARTEANRSKEVQSSKGQADDNASLRQSQHHRRTNSSTAPRPEQPFAE